MTRDESNRHLLPKFVATAALERTQTAIVGDLIIETGQALPSADDQLYRMRDESYLRGIPAVGRNAPGVIRGTIPGDDPRWAEGVRTVIV